MASKFSALSTSDLRRLRSLISQYEAVGKTLPPTLIRDYMTGQAQAAQLAGERAAVRDLEERRLAESTRIADERLRLQEQQIENADEAARMQGLTNLGTLAFLARDQIKNAAMWGYDKVLGPGAGSASGGAAGSGYLSTSSAPAMSEFSGVGGGSAAGAGSAAGGAGSAAGGAGAVEAGTGATASTAAPLGAYAGLATAALFAANAMGGAYGMMTDDTPSIGYKHLTDAWEQDGKHGRPYYWEQGKMWLSPEFIGARIRETKEQRAANDEIQRQYGPQYRDAFEQLRSGILQNPNWP